MRPTVFSRRKGEGVVRVQGKMRTDAEQIEVFTGAGRELGFVVHDQHIKIHTLILHQPALLRNRKNPPSGGFFEKAVITL